MIRSLSILLLAAALLAPSTASAHSHKKKGLEIIHPWTRATVDTPNTTGQVSMTIKNAGPSDRLLRTTRGVRAHHGIKRNGWPSPIRQALLCPHPKGYALPAADLPERPLP
jgi:hypothetical protein